MKHSSVWICIAFVLCGLSCHRSIERGPTVSADQTASLPTLLVVTPLQAVELPKAATSGFYPGPVDPFYNIQCDLLSGSDQVAFEENVRTSGGDWSKGFADRAAKHIGDTPFAVLALRDDVVVGWLRFYRAGECNLRAPVASQLPAAKALVICAAAVHTDEISGGTVRQMIAEAVGQAKRLGLSEVYAIASPDIRAYSAWCNQFMLKDYTACGFEVVEQTPSVHDSALYDMANGAHGRQVQTSVREDGITNTYTTSYYLVRRKFK